MQYLSINKVTEKPISGEWGKVGTKVKVLRTTNFTNDGKISYDNVVTRDIRPDKVEKKKLLNGDIIIEKSGGSKNQPVGRVVFFEKKENDIFLCNNFTAVLRPKKNVFPKYLFWFLFKNYQKGTTELFQNKTTGIRNLQTKRYLEDTKIPLPDIPTQKAIAARLDQAEAVKNYNQELLAKYDQLGQAIFLELFGDPVKNEMGWEVERLGEFGEFKNGINYSKSEKGNEIKVLGVKDFQNKWKISSMNLLTSIHINQLPSENYYLKDEDLVFVRSNGNKDLVGRCVVVYPGIEKITYSGFCIRFRLANSNLNVIHFAHLIRNKSFKNYALKNRRGANIQNINQKLLKNLRIPLPPLNLQTAFARRIENIERQKAFLRQEIEKSEELFNSLLQASFRVEEEAGANTL